MNNSLSVNVGHNLISTLTYYFRFKGVAKDLSIILKRSFVEEDPNISDENTIE
jgi:hypothetical protein